MKKTLALLLSAILILGSTGLATGDCLSIELNHLNALSGFIEKFRSKINSRAQQIVGLAGSKWYGKSLVVASIDLKKALAVAQEKAVSRGGVIGAKGAEAHLEAMLSDRCLVSSRTSLEKFSEDVGLLVSRAELLNNDDAAEKVIKGLTAVTSAEASAHAVYKQANYTIAEVVGDLARLEKDIPGLPTGDMFTTAKLVNSAGNAGGPAEIGIGARLHYGGPGRPPEKLHHLGPDKDDNYFLGGEPATAVDAVTDGGMYQIGVGSGTIVDKIMETGALEKILQAYARYDALPVGDPLKAKNLRYKFAYAGDNGKVPVLRNGQAAPAGGFTYRDANGAPQTVPEKQVWQGADMVSYGVSTLNDGLPPGRKLLPSDFVLVSLSEP